MMSKTLASYGSGTQTGRESGIDGTGMRLGRWMEVLSTAEKASLLAGVDDWHIRGFPEQGIPAMLVSDCGHGVTLCGERSSPATCFPTGIGLASTWNRGLMERVGGVIGRECLALGVSILLGPKLNLHRVPVNGRSFETFSEDPILAGRLGAALIRGIQAQGVGACVKAMACNNQQQDQHATNVVVDERTLRELYLRAFEIAVKEGRPCSAMTSYNPLNGHQAAESRWMITEVLKGDWGFEGFVVSDWRAVESDEVYSSGLDLEMPGPGKFLNTARVLRAVSEGLMTGEELDDHAKRILRVALTYGRDEEKRGKFSQLLDGPENRLTAREAAEESIVLLKNQSGLLPLDVGAVRRVAVIGPNAASARLGGGGSASVTPPYSVSPLEGLRALCGNRVEVVHEEGCGLVGSMHAVDGVFQTPDGTPGLLAEFFNSGEPEGKPNAGWRVPCIDFSWGWAAPGHGVTRYSFAARFSGQLVPAVSGRHRLGLYAQEGCARLRIGGEQVVDAWAPPKVEGDFEGAYATRYETVEVELVAGEPVDVVIEYGKRAARAAVRLEWEEPGAEDMIGRAVRTAASCDAVVLCCGLSNLFEGGQVDRADTGLPDIQESLIRRVAATNPNTIVVLNNGGPLTMPWEPDVAAVLEAWYPGQEGGSALAGILFGEVNPSGKLPDTLAHRFEDHASAANYPGDGREVRYNEGLFVGYRHFDKAGVEPHYPFGFGLSYTTFEIDAPELEAFKIRAGSALRFSVTVRNTGPRRGKETVQVYLENPKADSRTPDRVLVAFEKVDLEAGESASVAFELPTDELGEWDREHGRRVIAPGPRRLLAGGHSRSLRGTDFVIVESPA